MDEDDAYEWTEAEMLDTLQLVVAAEQQSAVEALETPPSGSQAARTSHLNQDSESSSALATEAIRASKQTVVRRQSSGSVRDSESSSSSPSMATTQKRQPFYHARQKHELEYLKSKVRELERDLLRIEQENEAKLAEDSDSIWQRMARQQNVERQKALSENVRLKELLEDQIQFARSLEKVIRKRPNLSALSGAQGSDRPTRRRKKAHTFASLHDEFSEDANRRYQRMDVVFQDMGVLDLVKEYRSLNLKVHDKANAESDVRVEQILVRRYPFSFREVGQELWNFLSVGSNLEQTGDVKREVDQTDDSLFATTTVKFPVGNRFCELTASALLRLFVEEDSYTVVWVSEGECAPPRSAKNSFKLSEHGWQDHKCLTLALY
ncbi:hypothetical protein Poli38472_002936 [Pythium oligandrum]|uniref:Uncharacterized protein n=1 Tax=Pythium oligandrum TaxID=41045 RepID=A0A8K1C5W2_PYTOL|nr:hypothetical protein Poli38472_002936 [Pythium oligandrum]|eukprot:TMW57011.1 hypothetical protein Poli38472_002936 [Pythium oligandrum]